MHPVTGIHHITAISSDPKETYHFYSGILGLRLVKKSINQDDVATYHLFFGNCEGSPGMDLTFFPFQPVRLGQNGAGCVGLISFVVPEDSLDFWQKRFDAYKVSYQKPTEHNVRQTLQFADGDGQKLELVAVPSVGIDPIYERNIWTTEAVSVQHAIRAFHSATLFVAQVTQLVPILELLGFEQTAENPHTYQIAGQLSAKYLELVESDDYPIHIPGAGTVHHIAFAIEDETELEAYRKKLSDLGVNPTPVIDRYYFKSVYFRTPVGILFELATHGPGFTADEDSENLGARLALPPFLEPYRQSIELQLPALEISNLVKKKSTKQR